MNVIARFALVRALRAAAIALAVALAGSGAIASELALDAARLRDAPLAYRDPARVAEHPVPAVAVRRAGLSAGPREFAEIREKVLYPFVVRSPKAVAAIVLEWYPGQPDALGVIVVYGDGDSRESQVPRSADGAYRSDAYAVLLARPTP